MADKMIWVVAIGFMIAIYLPIIPLLIIGRRRGWRTRQYGPYIISYTLLIALIIMAVFGVRGRELIGGLAITFVALLILFLGYSYVFDVEVPKLRKRE